MSAIADNAALRRTFAIISHPDAGKTTLTEKLLLLGGAIQLAGAVKGRKAARHATSDWMALERERGISVTTSVMQFPYRDRIINLLDTPGHGDFSEDTYRTLTAVDSALMVIDSTKGVEERTKKLLEVCRSRRTPILTFINKLDREGRPPLELLDEIERVLNIRCAPVTWPIGMGRQFQGILDLCSDRIHFYRSRHGSEQGEIVEGLENPSLSGRIEGSVDDLREEVELVREASYAFDEQGFQAGELTPVFFGSAINSFGIRELLDTFVESAPPPQPRPTTTRTVDPQEESLSGFVFKIQANMDPGHRDRIAFLRICSGKYAKNMRLYQVRTGKDIQVANAVTFMAHEREQAEEAYPGDVIGLFNHGTVHVGDTFTQGEVLKFTGIPNFAPELFRRVKLRDPLRTKALQKGLRQLCEEGATQLFRPLTNNELIVGAVGHLQFDVAAYRLRAEYGVECSFEAAPVVTARWITCDDRKRLEEFRNKAQSHLSVDGAGALAYLAPTKVNLDLTMERWPDIQFHATRELEGELEL